MLSRGFLISLSREHQNSRHQAEAEKDSTFGVIALSDMDSLLRCIEYCIYMDKMRTHCSPCTQESEPPASVSQSPPQVSVSHSPQIFHHTRTSLNLCLFKENSEVHFTAMETVLYTVFLTATIIFTLQAPCLSERGTTWRTPCL